VGNAKADVVVPHATKSNSSLYIALVELAPSY